MATKFVVADDNPKLGEAVSDADLAIVDSTIMPGGEGLPEGAGNAKTGAEVYQKNCLACHGAGGKEGVNDALAGGHGSLTSDRPKKTVGSYWPYATTLFSYIYRAMPYQSPGSLTDNEVYAVTAYILYLNDIIDDVTELDSRTLPGIGMPNRENFVWYYVTD